MLYEEQEAKSIADVIDIIINLQSRHKNTLYYFRGEGDDYGETALCPLVYRDEYLKKEHIIYREMQRFNDADFSADKSTFDRLSRLQHYGAPTRVLDISEDIMSAIYFAVENHDKNDAKTPIVYVLEIDKDKIKYYDSDSVSVVSNLTCIPLKTSNDLEKSKENLHEDALKFYNDKENFNKTESLKFLLHEIKSEKHYFEPIIVPEHIFSVFCVKPKYTSRRVRHQKGAFLLFGLNKCNLEEPISLMHDPEELTPIKKIIKIRLGKEVTIANLGKIGITTPYIYPEIEKVSEYLKKTLKNPKTAQH